MGSDVAWLTMCFGTAMTHADPVDVTLVDWTFVTR